MSSIFELEQFDNFTEKLDLNDLYENKRNADLGKLVLFQKMLNRVHIRIKTSARQKEVCCWFIVPEIILGVSRYNQGECIAFIMDKLQKNSFQVKYVHPNAIFITWANWIPSYIREEYKKKTGISIDPFGNCIEDENTTVEIEPIVQLHNTLIQTGQKNNTKKPIQKYIPNGKLVYNENLLNKIGDKLGL